MLFKAQHVYALFLEYKLGLKMNWSKIKFCMGVKATKEEIVVPFF